MNWKPIAVSVQVPIYRCQCGAEWSPGPADLSQVGRTGENSSTPPPLALAAIESASPPGWYEVRRAGGGPAVYHCERCAVELSINGK